MRQSLCAVEDGLFSGFDYCADFRRRTYGQSWLQVHLRHRGGLRIHLLNSKLFIGLLTGHQAQQKCSSEITKIRID